MNTYKSTLEGEYLTICWFPQVSRVAWQKTREYESVRQFLFNSRGAVVVSEAQCITHKVGLICIYIHLAIVT